MEQPDFSRYTDGARRAIDGGRAQARSQGRACVMPVDVLVGLLLDDEKSSAARRALDHLGVGASAVCQTIDRVEAGAVGQTASRRHVAATPLPEDAECTFGTDSRRIFRRAEELSERDNADCVGTEHVLLALYDDGLNAPLVRAILQDFGVKDGEDLKARDMLVGALAQAVASRSVEAHP